MAKKFNGVVNIDVRDSVPDWTPFRESPAPEGAPNVLVVLYDDTGLAAWSPYGGRINMPTMQKLADNGLTYTQWHTTALCSPTRSCLLTGRNHHQNGFAQIAEGAQGFPGHTGHVPMENATIGEVLRENGYNTYWVGKNHNVPLDEWAVGATRRNWPLARGFDRYYGFIGGETNNWYPTLAEDNHYIDQPYLPEEGYHLSKDLADKAISYIADSKTSAPKKPWYLWFCPGANHAPHHAPEEYIAKYHGKFDDGYEAYREWVLPRMVERGILPEGTGLTEINPLPGEAAQPSDHVRPWDDPVGRGEEALRPLRRGVRRASRSTPTPRSVGSSTTSRRPASSRTRSSCTPPTTARRARAARTARSTRTSSSTPTPRTSTQNMSMLDELGSPVDLQPLPDRVGDRVLDAVQDVQALHLPGRRRRPAGDLVAEGHRGPRRGAQPVPPRRRHRPDHPRVRRARDARPGAGVRAVRAPRSVHEVHLRGRRTDPEGDPVLRDDGHPRAVAARAGTSSPSGPPSRAATPRTSSTTPGSSTTPTRTAPSCTTSRTSTPTRSRSWSTSGTSRPASTTCCRSTTGRSPTWSA